MTLHSGANLGQIGEKWSERLDSNQRPLSPQKWARLTFKYLAGDSGTLTPVPFRIGSRQSGAIQGHVRIPALVPRSRQINGLRSRTWANRPFDAEREFSAAPAPWKGDE